MGLIRNITTVLRAWLLVAVLCVVSCSKGDIQDFVGAELSDSDSSSGKDGKDDKGDKGDDGNGQGDTPQEATAKATPRKTTLRCSCWATILLRQPVQ